MPYNNIYTNTKIITRNVVKSHETNILYTKIILISTVLLFFMPLCIGDIYYALNDNTCVQDKVQIQINLKSYLQISGNLSLVFVIIYIIMIIKLNYLNITIICNCAIGLSLVSLFSNFIFNIIGGIIFWELMDNSHCDNSVYNYVFISLIIKYFIGTLYFILINKPIKNDTSYINTNNSDESDDFEEINHLSEVFNNIN